MISFRCTTFQKGSLVIKAVISSPSLLLIYLPQKVNGLVGRLVSCLDSGIRTLDVPIIGDMKPSVGLF